MKRSVEPNQGTHSATGDPWSAVKHHMVKWVGGVLIASTLSGAYPSYHCLIETASCREPPAHLHDPSLGATAPNTRTPEYVMNLLQYTRGAAIATAPSTPSWSPFIR